MLPLERSSIEQAIINFNNFFCQTLFLTSCCGGGRKGQTKPVTRICVQEKGVVYEKNEKQGSAVEFLCASVCDGEGEEEKEEMI